MPNLILIQFFISFIDVYNELEKKGITRKGLVQATCEEMLLRGYLVNQVKVNIYNYIFANSSKSISSFFFNFFYINYLHFFPIGVRFVRTLWKYSFKKVKYFHRVRTIGL